MFRSFAIRNYRWWFAGALVSNVGTWMQRVAQDWLILTELTDDDATAVGVSLALQFGPQLALLPLTGLVADRMDRRRLLLLTQSFMAACGLGLGLITVLGVVELWMVFGFALAIGVGAAFDAPARQAFVSELVPAEHIGNAVALNSTSFHGARLVGPAIAGILVAAIGPGWVFLINAVTYVGVFGALAALRRSELVVFDRSPKRRGAIREGFRYVRRRGDIVLVLLMVFFVGMLGFNLPLFTAAMVRIEFDLDAGVFGILSSLIAVGSVTGALLTARRDRPRLRTIGFSAGGFGIGLLACAFMPNVWTFGAALVAVGFVSLTMMATANAYVQTTTSPAFRGRVMALYVAIFLGGTPVGAPFVGWVADAFGPRWALGVGAFSGFLAGAIALAWYIRDREVSVKWRWERWRWPLALRYGRGTPAERELATTEIAVIEAETQRG
jgi:MFS family permease